MTLNNAKEMLQSAIETKNQGGSMEKFKPFIEELISVLNTAAEKYYYETEILSNKEYDDLESILAKIEEVTGIILPNSPTRKAGVPIPNNGLSRELGKIAHSFPALSLDKTKDVNKLIDKFTKGEAMSKPGQEGTVLMWKCDGMTLVITYRDGKLVSAVTRGDGYIGEDVTHNAPYIKGLPEVINATGEIIIRGEAMISYEEFERVNSLLPENEELFKNPRNLVSATVRLSSDGENARMRNREVSFFAFGLTKPGTLGNNLSFYDALKAIENLGVQTVPHVLCSATDGTLEKTIAKWSSDEEIKAFGYPVDGLVVALNDVTYASTLPGTEHNPHIYCGYALKWQDETKETILRQIEWSPSKTGLLNPVAIFDPVDLEGTTVSRASLHNVSYVIEKDLRIGDKITVYKANKIIPQVDTNISAESRIQQEKDISLYDIADMCPVCGSPSKIQVSKDGIKTLRCDNAFCPAKKIGKFVHLCERNCLNIVGLSEKKIEFLINNGYIQNFDDLFTMQSRKKANGKGVTKINNQQGILEDEPGWDVKSVDNLLDAIEIARKTNFCAFINSMSIPNIGKGQSKLLLKHLQSIYDLPEYKGCHTSDSYDLINFMSNLVYKFNYDFSVIDGFGKIIGNSLNTWIRKNLIDPIVLKLDEKDTSWEVLHLLKHLQFTDYKPNKHDEISSITGMTFVITGSLNIWKNRDALIADIESLGGKVSGSVSKNTTYLINNDITSTSGKNKKAKELGIPIISETDFAKMIGL